MLHATLIDDWGLEKLDLGQRNDMLELIEDRHGSRSTLITSQLPVKDGHSTIGDATPEYARVERDGLIHVEFVPGILGLSMMLVQERPRH